MGSMNRRRRVVVWLGFCRKAWSMLGGAHDQPQGGGELSVTVALGDGPPSITSPLYVLKPDTVVVAIERGIRKIPGGDGYELYEEPIYESNGYETYMLAYGQRAPERVTS